MKQRRYAKTALLIVALPLAGCSSEQSTYYQYFKIARQTIGSQFSDEGITRQQAAAVPYASMGYRVDGGREQLIVLATDNAGEQLWTASSHVVLVTRDGRIRRTVGLPKDLGGTTSNGGDFPSPARALKASFTTTRQQDFPDMGLYATTVQCRAVARGRTDISILGSAISTNRIDEICSATGLTWNFTDSYWVDPQTGRSWKTVQHIHPSGETIETEIFRPPG